MIRFVATDVFDYHRPSRRRLRVYLRAHGVEETRPGPFEETLRRLGKEHEAQHLRALAASTDVADLSAIEDRRERERETLRLLSQGAPAIYQGRLSAVVDLDGEKCEIVGEPDFLISHGPRSRHPRFEARAHDRRRPAPRNPPPAPALRFPVLQPLSRCTPAAAKSSPLPTTAARRSAASTSSARFERPRPSRNEPVGWSKCGGCGFREHCWTSAAKLTVTSSHQAQLASYCTGGEGYCS